MTNIDMTDYDTRVAIGTLGVAHDALLDKCWEAYESLDMSDPLAVGYIHGIQASVSFINQVIIKLGNNVNSSEAREDSSGLPSDTE